MKETNERQALSINQQALWLIYREEPRSAAYNISLPLRFAHSLDFDILGRCLDLLLVRHPSLAGAFEEERGEILCRPRALDRLPLRRIPFANAPANESAESLLDYLAALAAEPFDLSRSAARAVLLENTGGCVLLLTFHHIVTDGHSLSIIGRDLVDLYARVYRGEPIELRSTIKPPDFAAWERNMLSGARGARMEAYWRERLGGEAPILQLPTDRPRAAVRGSNGEAVIFEIDAGLGKRLAQLAADRRSSLVNVLLCAYQILLHRYTGQPSIRIGVPTAVARNEEDFKNEVGYFVNLMIIEAKFPEEQTPSFRELLDATSREMLAGLFHQPYPFPLLARMLSYQRDRSLTPLIQTTFSFTRKTLTSTGFEAEGCAAELIDLPEMMGQFDLSLAIIRENPLRGMFLYNTDLFDRTTIERIAEHFRRLLSDIIARPDQPIDTLNLLTDADAWQLQAWNDTETKTCTEIDLITRFEAQAERSPNARALVWQQTEWSYAELNTRANRVAYLLIGMDVGPGSLVGVCMQRNMILIACLLGILKAGAAYVPMDPTHPGKRLAGMLEDSQVAVLMTQRGILQRHPWLGAEHSDASPRIIELDADSDPWETSPMTNPSRSSRADDLAHVLFTSGSTGRPKGVMIRHQGVSRLLSWATATFPSNALRGVLASTSITFDLSIFEIFVPLVAGGAVILAENVLELPSLPCCDQVSLINTVPSAMTELLRNEAIPRSVRTVNLAGEALKKSLAQGLYALPHTEAVYNLYGPSEDTTYSTWSLVARDSADPPRIGRPLGNTRAYILDARLQPLPPGLSGELCLAGMGLAQGYLRRPDLTAERFVEIELFGRLERIYRTGDLARWLPDGQLQYLGRMDHQIKLRGYRIELGEIEAALTDHAGVDDAIVLLDETTDNPRLVAYVGSLRGSARKEALLAHLRARLPDYMIPSLIQVLPALPLNPNGKIDRARLPKPVIERGEFAPPRDISEQRVAEVWREVLDLTRIGIDENFFDLGGHSLLLTRVHFLLRRDYPGLHFVDLFGYPTARRLAAHLRALCADGTPAHTTAATQTIAAQARTRAAERRVHRARLQGNRIIIS